MLFLIPKNAPPSLEPPFSKPFRDFVSLCLQRDPLKRPTATQLLKHPFIRKAKKTSLLVELIERHKLWKMQQADDGSRLQHDDDSFDDDQEDSVAQEDAWDFGTVRPVAAANAGTVRGMPQSISSGFDFGDDDDDMDGISTHDFARPLPLDRPPQQPVRHGSTDSAPETVRVRNVPNGHANAHSALAAPSSPREHSSVYAHSHYTQASTATSGASDGVNGHERRELDRERHRILSQQHQLNGHDSDSSSEEGEESITDTVVLPVLDSLHDRITNAAAQHAVLKFRRAVQEIERDVPGLMRVFVAEVVASVEPEEAAQ